MSEILGKFYIKVIMNTHFQHRKIFILLLLCGLIINGIDQVYGQELTFDHLTINEGLSNNTVYSIVEDTDGFMWFGTRDGLNRFDGREFKVFDIKGESVSLNNIQALCLYEGEILVGLSTGGIAKYVKQNREFIVNPFKTIPSFNWSTLRVSSLFVDSFGNLWIGSIGSGVIRIDSEKNVYHYHSLAEPSESIVYSPDCTSFAEDQFGNIWMGTSGELLHYYDRGSDRIEVIRDEELNEVELFSFRKPLLFRDSVLLIGTDGNGVIAYEPETKKAEYFLSEKVQVRDLEVDHNGTLYISTDGAGLIILDKDSEDFTQLVVPKLTDTGINTNALYNIYIDSRRNVWIGSFNGGINVHKPNKAKFYTYQRGLYSDQSVGINSVLSIAGDGEELMIGLDGGGLSILDDQMNVKNEYNSDASLNSLCSNIITSQYVDSEGDIWMGTFLNGLIYHDRKNNSFRCYVNDPMNPNSINNNNVWAIESGQSDALWLGTLGGGLNHFDPETGIFKHYIPTEDGSNGISDLNIYCLLLDSKGRLWIGTEYAGLDLFDQETGKFINFSFDVNRRKGLRSNSIRCLFEDSNSVIWIGTEGGGLHKLDDKNGQILHYGLEDGLPSRVINSIEEDGSGNLWISTNKGISKLNTADNSVTNFYKEDGLLSNQYNANSSFTDEDGRMYFGSINGMSYFDPKEVSPYTSNAEFVFLDFKIQGNSILYDENVKKNYPGIDLNNSPVINLDYNESFSLEFSSLDFTYPNDQKYKYRIREISQEWINIDRGVSSLNFSEFKPGAYTFDFIDVNRDLSNSEFESLNVYISAPFWQRLWFRSLLVALFLLIIIAYFQFRINRRKLEHKNELMAMEQEILLLSNKNLGEMVEKKSSELSAALLQTAHKNKSLNSIKKKLNELIQQKNNEGISDKREINSLIKRINNELESENYWELFQINFDNVHQNYTQKLIGKHPELSSTELRVCTLVKLGMSNSEIANIQNISLSAVEKSKYRIKKKLQFSKHEDLNSYLISFS